MKRVNILPRHSQPMNYGMSLLKSLNDHASFAHLRVSAGMSESHGTSLEQPHIARKVTDLSSPSGWIHV